MSLCWHLGDRRLAHRVRALIWQAHENAEDLDFWRSRRWVGDGRRVSTIESLIWPTEAEHPPAAAFGQQSGSTAVCKSARSHHSPRPGPIVSYTHTYTSVKHVGSALSPCCLGVVLPGLARVQSFGFAAPLNNIFIWNIACTSEQHNVRQHRRHSSPLHLASLPQEGFADLQPAFRRHLSSSQHGWSRPST